jgi:hypothetical protein
LALLAFPPAFNFSFAAGETFVLSRLVSVTGDSRGKRVRSHLSPRVRFALSVAFTVGPRRGDMGPSTGVDAVFQAI